MREEHLSEESVEKFKEEAEVMSSLKHENIAEFYEYNMEEVLTTPNGKQYPAVSIIQEFCCEGDLFDFILYHDVLPESLARYYFGQLCSAVRHLQKQGFSHRDLKCENLVLDQNFRLKMIDFGFSAFANKSKTYCGTAKRNLTV